MSQNYIQCLHYGRDFPDLGLILDYFGQTSLILVWFLIKSLIFKQNEIENTQKGIFLE